MLLVLVLQMVLSSGRIVGYHAVLSVVLAFRSPLKSVTNAISGVTAVGDASILSTL